MKTPLAFLFIFLSSTLLAAEKPNILLIMADDLGYSDLGCYGGEIATPNLDSIAENGLRFTQFYNTARCWPTRGSLMTGYYAQQIRRDKIPGIPASGGGNTGIRPKWAPLLSDLLKPQGYRSYHVGKWHIDGMPLQNGFDRSYYLKDQSRFFSPNRHWLDDKLLPVVERDSGYYGTIELADRAVEFLGQHSAEHAEKPFFCYLAFAAPHFPLHALPEDIAKYEDTYQKGWDAIRAARFAKLKELGIYEGKLSDVELDLGPPYHFPDHLEILGDGEVNRPLPWDQLSEAEQEFQGTKMAIHAAMIDRMDHEIGRVLEKIREMGQLENTLVVFLSDNGASAEIMVRGDGHDPEAPMGSASTYLCLGPGWSTACNTPFRRHKTWTHEGGSSTPFVVSWPKGIAARGELRTNPGHVIDVVPTILELVGTKAPETWGGSKVPSPPGKSLVPVFAKDGTVEHESLWWFHDGHKAVRKGDWKLVAAKGEPWELFEITKDRAESNDLSRKFPQRVRELEAEWNRQMEIFWKMAKTQKP